LKRRSAHELCHGYRLHISFAQCSTMVFGCSPPSFDGELAVDYHVWYALGILMRIQELSFFLYSPRVEYHYVSSQSRAQILASIHSPPQFPHQASHQATAHGKYDSSMREGAMQVEALKHI